MRLPRHLALLLLAGLALVAVPAAPAGAADVPCRRTFSSGVVDLAIPDVGSAESVIDMPEDGLVVSDVDVTIDVRHPDARDLDVLVVSRADSAGAVVLDSVYEGQQDDFGSGDFRATFDDEARTPITWADPPFVGRFLRFHPLAIHDGRTGGRFVLAVADDGLTREGRLNSWSLAVTYRTCDFDADGVEDHRDQCRGQSARTASGCPRASRRVSAAYRAGKFRGTVSSPVRKCEARRPVSVFRARSGRDARVGTTRTRADGSWRLLRAKRPGRYYATAPRAVVPGVAECPSRSVRVRLR